MNLVETGFKDVVIIEPKLFEDSRGYFFESFNQLKFANLGLDYHFVQDNEAKSTKAVLRGLHYQLPPYTQTKLVRVVQGEVLDVIVDLREDSEMYGKYFSVVLSDQNFKQLLVPKGFAHGYVVLSDEAIFAYKCDQYYHQPSERGIIFNDKDLNIDWILNETDFIVSEKDLQLPTFEHHFPIKFQ